jgi:hypothetical protein
VQVVALRRTQHEVHIVPSRRCDAAERQRVRVVPQGQSLALGDVLEIAGAKLEVIVPTKRSSA